MIPGITALEPRPERAGPREGNAAASGSETVARRFWREIPLGWALVAVLLVGGGVVSSWISGADRSDTGDIDKAGAMDPTDLRPGDCFDLEDAHAEEIGDVTAKPCTEEHEFEAFFVGSMPEGTYPDERAIEQYVVDNCDPVFVTYVGRSFDQSGLAMTWLFPLSDSWQAGDRSIQCVVHDPQKKRLTESLKGSNR